MEATALKTRHFSLNKTIIHAWRKESSAHFATCKRLILLRIILDRIGVLLSERSGIAQSSSEVVRFGGWISGGWSRVGRGRDAVSLCV